MNHNFAVWQSAALAFLTRHEQERAHRRRHADAHRAHLRLDVLHGIINCHTSRHRTAGAVDVQADIGIRVFHFQKEHLRHDGVRHVVVDFATQEDNTILEQAGINVIRPLAAVGLFDHIGDQIHCVIPPRCIFILAAWIAGAFQRIFPAQCTPFGAHLCVRRIFCSCSVFCIF